METQNTYCRNTGLQEYVGFSLRETAEQHCRWSRTSQAHLLHQPSIYPSIPLDFTHCGRVTGRLTILKSPHQMFTFSVCGRRLLLLCCLQIMILIVMKYASGCSEHSKHQMKAVLLILSTRLFRTAARVSATVSTCFLRTSTRTLFQAFFCSSQRFSLNPH